MTANHLSWKTDISLDCCAYILRELEARDLVQCLNPASLRSRVYWFTEAGKKCRAKISRESELRLDERNIAEINWELYGWLCFAHRATVTIALTEPLQPSAIKRKLRQQLPHLNISANNIRDIIKLLLRKGVVRGVSVKKKAHMRYELTEEGETFQKLLIGAGMNKKH